MAKCADCENSMKYHENRGGKLKWKIICLVPDQCFVRLTDKGLQVVEQIVEVKKDKEKKSNAD